MALRFFPNSNLNPAISARLSPVLCHMGIRGVVPICTVRRHNLARSTKMHDTQSLSQKLSALISPDAGKSQPLSDDDKKFVAEYDKAVSALPPEMAMLAFRNVIRNEGRCGFASGGSYHYLINTDGGSRYRVTVRTAWRQGIDSGTYDTTYISEAGGRQNIGCSDSGSIPVAYYTRTVVGEVRI